MDDIESGATPRWDGDYHDYANGLDVFLQPNTTGSTGDAGVGDVFTTGVHNDWGRVDKGYTRHFLTSIPGNGGKMRLSHKPCCGLLNSNYYLPTRYALWNYRFKLYQAPLNLL